VARNRIFLLSLIAVTLLGVNALAQAPSDGLPGLKSTFVGSALTCSAPQAPQTEKLMVPAAVARRAKLKARLLNLLHLSLYDDVKGIVNPSREKEISDLAGKLKKDKEWESPAFHH